MKKVIVSKHAAFRMDKRVDLPTAKKKIAKDAYEKGTIVETARSFGGYKFVFDETKESPILITVIKRQ